MRLGAQPPPSTLRLPSGTNRSNRKPTTNSAIPATIEEACVAQRELPPQRQPARSCGSGEVLTQLDPVADARHGLDHPRLAEALAQRRDGDAYGVGERIGVLIPRALEQVFGAHDSAAGGHEHIEHRELLARESDVAPVAVHLTTKAVEPDAGDLDDRRRPRCRATAERAHAQHQLAQRERLGQVVVGAALEAGRLVVEPVGGGEHEDARTLRGARRAAARSRRRSGRGCRGRAPPRRRG